ncbi:MAG: M50 family metallopeptidase [Gemmatimonadota bacterium]|nr:M50 family metallopeptidase [Gemmatimonadota bacterium]
MARKKPTGQKTARTGERAISGAALGAMLLFFVALWLLWETPVVAPLKLFVVFLHEISHGIVAIATGGRIDRIVVDANQGGACYCGGGSAFLTLSAGYLGSLLWGLAFLALARFEAQARWTMAAVGVATAAVTVLFMRNLFGFAFGVGFAAALVLAARQLPARWNARILFGLGLTSALYAILDIKSDVIDRSGLESDARMLADLTGVPTVVWGALWIGLAGGIVALVARRAFARS